MTRVGFGVDVHPFARQARPLVLAGVEVDPERGLEGHSDADVLAHAVTDGLLGALAWGDIGARFGVDDPATAGARSLDLLAHVVADVEEAGWRLGNVHATVVAQAPRLAPFRDRCRGALAEVLHADVDSVGLSFTTTDRLGFLGRGEGVAATAAVLLERVSGPRTGGPDRSEP